MQNERAYSKAEYGELFKQNYSRFFYCALDFVEDTETARDIVGDVTYETWQRLDKLASAGHEINLVGYMLNSIRNHAMNFLRHKAVENAHIKEVLSTRESIADDSAELHEERLKRIDNILDSLDPQTQQIFRLCWYKGYKYKEAADELGLTVSLVHKRISRAFATFREQLGVKLASATVTIIALTVLFI